VRNSKTSAGTPFFKQQIYPTRVVAKHVYTSLQYDPYGKLFWEVVAEQENAKRRKEMNLTIEKMLPRAGILLAAKLAASINQRLISGD
jgi:hypothetical protein